MCEPNIYLNGFKQSIVDEHVLFFRLNEVISLTANVLQKPEHVQLILELDLRNNKKHVFEQKSLKGLIKFNFKHLI
jgi:predicted RNA-binding protein